MKINRKILTGMLTTVLVLLVACNNSTDELSSKSNEQSLNNNSTENADGDSTTKDLTDHAAKSSDGTDNTQQNEQKDASNHTSKNSNNEESLKSSDSDSEVNESKKDEYFRKLNAMEESDRYSEAGTTVLELEEQEKDRYTKWDKELNEIYGVLMEQLSTEQMDKLRDEQRNWIKYRDDTAKESSQQYKGGSSESLEYIATQASLTRERCYELVAKYMK
ncbi:Protein of unknown function [Salinibacillus kushneri]|uniref:Lysozyme inhibitor LprI-like N-terminal domain-containing protein n=1 Tax=Salinibacillus kushneri TaxID=237682 RepID=A0A1I0DIH6_9BACI|nr:lysozyme inhibitor LprI family protein [Salinibacillus kushneri]SET31853.1 Protein of unknown function [Salinibacillus kushneri]